MTWTLATATGRYVVDLAPEGAGPVLADWTDAEPRPWSPDPGAAFVTPADRLPSEYSALGTRHVRTADLIVEQEDGLVGARLTWSQDAVEFTDDGVRSTFTAVATDHAGRLTVRLGITASREHDVVAKHAEITNTGSAPLTLRRAFAPAWELPCPPPVRVGLLAGAWSREFQPHELKLPAGELSLGSRQGVTGHTYSPVVSVDGGTGAYGVSLAWSGSWRLAIEAVPFALRTRVAGGVEDESSLIRLAPARAIGLRPRSGYSLLTAGTACAAAGTTTSGAGWPARSVPSTVRSSTTPGTPPPSRSSPPTSSPSPSGRPPSARRCSSSTTAGSPAGTTIAAGSAIGGPTRTASPTGWTH